MNAREVLEATLLLAQGATRLRQIATYAESDDFISFLQSGVDHIERKLGRLGIELGDEVTEKHFDPPILGICLRPGSTNTIGAEDRDQRPNRRRRRPVRPPD